MSSASPKDTLALGLAIVNELKLETRGALLERWMAHHLAGTMLAAESASGAKKAKLEKETVNLILKLWLHRRALPERVDPLAGCREAIKVLQLLQPAANPWSRFSSERNSTKVQTLSKLFDAMSRAMVGALVLTHTKYCHEPTDVQLEHLDPAEQRILEAISEWLPMVDKSPQPPEIVIVDSSKHAEVIDLPSEPTVEMSEGEELAAKMQSMLAENLKSLHTQLGSLITKWEANQVPAS